MKNQELKTLQDYSVAWQNGKKCRSMFRDRNDRGILCNDPIHFLDLTEQEQTALLDWIKKEIIPCKTYQRCRSSYGIKHTYHNHTGNYVTNGQFKGAMIVAGFKPNKGSALNPCYQHRKIREVGFNHA